MTRRELRAEATAFRIWREGKSVDWDCTVLELAEAVGVNPNTVRSICRERGWPVNQDNPGGFREIDVDRLIAPPSASAAERSGRLYNSADQVTVKRRNPIRQSRFGFFCPRHLKGATA